MFSCISILNCEQNFKLKNIFHFRDSSTLFSRLPTFFMYSIKNFLFFAWKQTKPKSDQIQKKK